MQNFTPLRMLSIGAALALIAGCSSVTAIAPKPASPQAGPRLVGSEVPPVVIGNELLNISPRVNRLAGYYSCPLTGPITYLSDQIDSVINVFAGIFSSQAPCGQLASGLIVPVGLYVDPLSRDLYVADSSAHEILVFHRGQSTPYNIYTDPTGQRPSDVTLAKDGTVIAGNETNLNNTQGGSISTWRKGPNGGTPVGNFSTNNGAEVAFLTLQKKGKVLFESDDVDNGNKVNLWSVKCALGHCGNQTMIAAVSIKTPTGLASDANDDLIVASIGSPSLIETFVLPNPQPSTFPANGAPLGIALNTSDKHLFVASSFPHTAGAVEYSYPSGVLIGSVTSTAPFGIAVDPGHAP